jgi:hypothetical protein
LIHRASILSTRTGSSESNELALAWLKECRDNHPECSQVKDRSTELPTRVVDVANGEACQLTLQCNTKDLRGPYIALSYCWGSGQRVSTTTSNIAARQRSIEIEELPLTIQHAIQVTRNLGYRWLWIDQLCIIQDSPEDQRRELALMDDIYANAVLTIAAAKGNSVEDGLFVERDPRWYMPCRVARRATDGFQDLTGKGLFLRPKLKNNLEERAWYGFTSFFEHHLNNLDERGWTLQEALLSTRILIFGPLRLQWSCLRGSATEESLVPRVRGWCLGHPEYQLHCFRVGICQNSPTTPLDQGSLKSMTKKKGMSRKRRQLKSRLRADLYKFWCAVVTNYSRRDLSFHQDKLPALSGLAKRMHLICNTDYLAGLWQSEFTQGLLWYVESRRPNAASGAPVPYLSPSWSWISQIDKQVSFVNDYLCWNLGKLGMTKIKAKCKLATNNPFGPVKDGYLLVTGTMKQAKARVTGEDCEIKGFEDTGAGRWGGTIMDEESGRTIGGINFDDDVQILGLIEFDFLLVLATNNGRHTTGSVGRFTFRGLAIVKKDNSEDYQRIGLATIVEQDWLGNIIPHENGFGTLAVDDDQKYRKRVRIV